MTPKYLSLKTAKTTKIGERTEGYIHYRVLSDQDQILYFNITGNDDLGYYSKEVIPFEMIEHVIKDIGDDGTVTLNTKVQDPNQQQQSTDTGKATGPSVDKMAASNSKNIAPKI